jgi:cytochrome c oxidase subunit 4
MDKAMTSGSAHEHAEGQQHPIRIYLVIWVMLFVLSTFSYLVDYFQLHGLLRWSLKFAILIPPLCLLVLIALMAIEGTHTFLTRLGAFVH